MAFKGWKRKEIIRDNGEYAEAISPVIISASRSTDIPAFYGEWLVSRLRKGYIRWDNPHNGRFQYVSFDKTRVFVFWTKNAGPFLPYLASFDSINANYYFHFTLNDYEQEGYEPCMPVLSERLAVFRELSRRIGPERVIWRFDPLLFSDNLTVEQLILRIDALASALAGYTKRLVISFIDIEKYCRVKKNLSRMACPPRELSDREKIIVATHLENFKQYYDISVGTCAEEIDLKRYGIRHNRCIDDRLMLELFPNDTALSAFLADSNLLPSPSDADPVRRHPLKDKGQRKFCGCVASKDIGHYGTCPHRCAYCYANSSGREVMKNAAGAGVPENESLLKNKAGLSG